MRTLIALAIIAMLAVPAFAGDGGCCGGCPLSGARAEGSCDVDGFSCQNMCPLAKQANACRSLGSESRAISVIVRKDLADEVAANLQRI